MRWKPIIVVAAAAVSLAGCNAFDLSLLQEVGVDPAKAEATVKKIEAATLGNAAKALPVYCKAPKSARDLFRNRFNARPEAKAAKIGVHCPGDPPLVLN